MSGDGEPWGFTVSLALEGAKRPLERAPQILPGAPGTNCRDPVSFEMCSPLPALPL